MSGFCPYVGLQPFSEEDYPYFFGRERDVRIISSNLQAQPLTVLYGPSGVGKSSVLRAGVLAQFRSGVDGAVVYYNSWQSDSFLHGLTERCRIALDCAEQNVPLDSLVSTSGRRLFLVLDQFEELLLHRPSGDAATEFDVILARLINREDLAVNVLIGIREDALSRFDQRFSIRIGDLLGNTLPLDHLTYAAGRRAILGPLDIFNQKHRAEQQGVTIERELVEEVLRQVAVRRFAETATVAHGDPADEGRVESPFLQLVLRRLWEKEEAANSQQMRLETLRKIGGARQIVDQHVNGVLSSLPQDGDREIAARIFRYLVTPSRSKISQTTSDLISFAEASEPQVQHVLVWLSNKPESRILRRMDTPERYELFHDVLAQPILDWRRTFVSQKEAAERDRKQGEETARTAREVRRLRRFAAALALLVVVSASLAWLAFSQRKRADAAALSLVQSQNLAQADRDRLREVTLQRSADQAALKGQTALAGEFEQQAALARQEAVAADKRAANAQEQIAVAAEGRDQSYRDALQRAAALERGSEQLQGRVTGLTAELALVRKQQEQERESAKESIARLEQQLAAASAKLAPSPGVQTGIASSPGVSTPGNPADSFELGRLLQRYQDAYQDLDANAVHSFDPKVDAVALARTFKEYRSYTLDIRIEGIEISGQTARITALMTRTVAVTTGPAPPANSRREVIAARKINGSWVIEGIVDLPRQGR